MRISKDANLSRKPEKIQANTIFWIILLVIVSIFLGWLPVSGFGQGLAFPEVTAPAPQTAVADPAAFAPIDPLAATPTQPGFSASTPPAPAPAMSNPATAGPMASPAMLPPPVASTASTPPGPMFPMSARSPQPVVASAPKEPTAQQLKEQPELLRSVSSPNHPFSGYFDSPKDAQSLIKGKSYSVAQLLDGVRNPTSRRQLLQAYWELAGQLAAYNMCYDAELRVGQWYADADRARDTTRSGLFMGTFHLLQQRRKVVEIEFVKQQYQLTELIKRMKGVAITEADAPIPNDYPICKKYETYADSIARTDRARYLDRMISIQEQMIGAKQSGYRAAETILVEAMKNPANGQELVASLKQRTAAYAEMVSSVVEYNKLIAEYSSETIGPAVSQYRLIGALIELPKYAPGTPPGPRSAPEGRQPNQVATPTAPFLSDRGPRPAEISHPIPAHPMPVAEQPQAMYADQPASPQRTFAPQPLPTPNSPTTAAYDPAEGAMTQGERAPVRPVSHVEEERSNAPGPPPAPQHPIAPAFEPL